MPRKYVAYILAALASVATISGFYYYDYKNPLEIEYDDRNADGILDSIVVHRYWDDEVHFGYLTPDGVAYRTIPYVNSEDPEVPPELPKSPRP